MQLHAMAFHNSYLRLAKSHQEEQTSGRCARTCKKSEGGKSRITVTYLPRPMYSFLYDYPL